MENANANIPIEEEPNHIGVYEKMWVYDELPQNARLLFVKHQSKVKSRRFKFSAYNKFNVFQGNFIHAVKTKEELG